MEKIKKEMLDKIDKIELFISYALKFFIFGLLVTSIIRLRYFLIFSSAFILILTFLPSLIEKNYKINLPVEFDFVITTILWLHFVLGEVNEFYHIFPWWDIFLHYASSILLGVLGFTIVYTLFFTQQIKANPFFIALFTITFALSIGAVWEIFEFSMDSLFGFNMQKSGLIDTMWDLIIDAIGAFFIGIAGYFYEKNPRKGILDRVMTKILVFNKEKMMKNI